jgi:chitinase
MGVAQCLFDNIAVTNADFVIVSVNTAGTLSDSGSGSTIPTGVLNLGKASGSHAPCGAPPCGPYSVVLQTPDALGAAGTGIVATPSVTQTIQPSADVTGLIIKQSNTTNTADVFSIQDKSANKTLKITATNTVNVAGGGCIGCTALTPSTTATIWNTGYDTPFGSGYLNLADFDWGSVTHINMVGGTPQADGSVVLTAGFAAHAVPLIAAAHANGVKVLYTLGSEGGGSYDYAGAITNHLALLTTNIMSTVNTYGFDGVDVDFEAGYTQPLMASHLTSLRTALGSNLLTADALESANSDWAIAGMQDKVDRIEILTYNNDCCSSLSFFNDGLYCMFDTADCTQKYVKNFVGSAGIAASKISIGIAFYGVLDTGNAVAGPRQNPGNSRATEINYYDIVGSHSAARAAAVYDAQAHSVWAPDSGGYMSWNEPQNVLDKAQYVIQSGLGGWFTWNLGNDYLAGQVPTHPLQNALKMAYQGYLQTPKANDAGLTDSTNSINLRGNRGNSVQVLADFTTANNANLQAIVDVNGNGLRWYNPAYGKYRASFSCDIAYSQATANVAVAFGIQEQSHIASTAPTNIFVTGTQQITVGPPATFVAGTLTGLNSTTATNVVSGTPGATATKYTAHLGGTIEMPTGTPTAYSAEQFQIMVSTAAGADAVTVYRGSQCILGQ